MVILLKAILFDLGNTLINYPDLSESNHAFREILIARIHQTIQENGYPSNLNDFRREYYFVREKQWKDARNTLIEFSMTRRLKLVLKNLSYSIEESNDALRKAMDSYMQLYITRLKEVQHSREALSTLQKDFQLGLITNFAYAPGIYAVLDTFNLKQFFEKVIISGEVGWRKPSPKIFIYALNSMKIQATNTVYIGDDYKADIVGAKNVGMKTVFISKEPEDYQKADVIIETLKELPSTIKELFIG